MGSEAISTQRRDDIAIVRFDRGGSGNALNQETILGLTQVAQELRDDCDVRAVVLTGAADNFSAGFDLKEKLPRQTGPGAELRQRQRYRRGGRLCQAWEDLPQPTIAAMEGMAVGGGVALPLALDWRVMASNAYLLVPEVLVGMNLQWGALPRLVALVGPARAKTISILCEKMGAEQAAQWGLADIVCEPGQALESAVALARKAAAMPAGAAQMVKQLANAAAHALNRAVSNADYEQCQLADSYEESLDARRQMVRQLKK